MAGRGSSLRGFGLVTEKDTAWVFLWNWLPCNKRAQRKSTPKWKVIVFSDMQIPLTLYSWPCIDCTISYSPEQQLPVKGVTNAQRQELFQPDAGLTLSCPEGPRISAKLILAGSADSFWGKHRWTWTGWEEEQRKRFFKLYGALMTVKQVVWVNGLCLQKAA